MQINLKMTENDKKLHYCRRHDGGDEKYMLLILLITAKGFFLSYMYPRESNILSIT